LAARRRRRGLRLFWLASEPKPVAVQAASDGAVGGRFDARLDVAAVDSDGRRALWLATTALLG
jgi:hypothetical protein